MNTTRLALSLTLLAIVSEASAQTYSVPIRWCTIANDTNGNGQMDSGESGAPAFTNPAGVGEPDTDNVLWRRHERPTDAVFIPEANITFRSAIYNIVEDATLRFPIIADPDPDPTGDSFWQPGDILSQSTPSFEWNAAHNACVDAWREQHGVEDIGVVVLNANHYRSLLGDSEPGAAVLNGRRMILRDNAYLLPGSPLFGQYESPPDTGAVRDHVDKHFGHEIGHALAGLRHTCATTQNIMSNRRADTTGDNQVDNIHLSTSIEEIFNTADCPATDLPAVDQIALLRSAAQSAPGCKLAGTNTDCTVRSDVRADRIRDADLPFLDLSLVNVAQDGPLVKLVHEPMGPLDRRRFRRRDYVDYFLFFDQDGDETTGGDAEALGVPIPFKGAELVTRVRVSLSRGKFHLKPTVWRFEAGAFAEMRGRFRAYAFALIAMSDRGTAHLSDQITLELPLELFGAGIDHFRLQAAVMPNFSGKPRVVDVLDDGSSKPGKQFRWRAPTFPVCSVAPGVQERGKPITVMSSGLQPNQGVHLVFGHRHIANGHADASGAVKITTAIPADARDGRHLITVGTDGTALTADCVTLVKGGPRPPQREQPTHPSPAKSR